MNLPWHPALDKFINDHMMSEESDSKKEGSKQYLHTQSEISSNVADKWKDILKPSELKKMNTTCHDAITTHEKLTMF